MGLSGGKEVNEVAKSSVSSFTFGELDPQKFRVFWKYEKKDCICGTTWAESYEHIKLRQKQRYTINSISTNPEKNLYSVFILQTEAVTQIQGWILGEVN